MSGSDDDLHRELQALRQRVEAIERRLAIPAAAPPERNSEAAKPVAPKSETPARSPQLETRVGLAWINRIGVITLLLGAGFFFKYAVDNEWIGVTARVILGGMAGALALYAGEFLYRRKQTLFAQGISGLGIALVYLTVYAAYQFYRLLPDVLAFSLLGGATGGGAALALRYEAMPVAALGLFGGYMTPLLVRPAPWILYGYTLLLDAAAIALSRARNWKLLEWLALCSTALLFATSPARNEVFLGTFFLGAYYALFAQAQQLATRVSAQSLAAIALAFVWVDKPLGYLLCSLALAVAGLAIEPAWALGAYWLGYAVWSTGAAGRPAGPTFAALTLVFLIFLAWVSRRPGQLVMMALNGPVFFAASYLLLDSDYHGGMGLLALALAAAHLFISRRLLAGAPQAALLALGLAAAFLTIAIPVQLSGYTITVAWATEAAALAWIASRYEQTAAAWGAFGILALVMFRLAAFDSERPALRLITFTASAVAFWLVSRWTPPGKRALAIYLAGHGIMVWGFSMEIEAWSVRTAAPQNAVCVSSAGISIMLAADAVSLIGAGVLTTTTVNRILGLAPIGLVIAKLYLYDVWLLGRLYRTIAFVALGALLLTPPSRR